MFRVKTHILFLNFSLLILSLSALGQHTERFKNLVKNLNPSEIKTDTTFYGNGKIFMIESFRSYEFEGQVYSFNTGPFNQYYRNGKPMVEATFDNYGIMLSYIKYESSGGKSFETFTKIIDTKAKDLKSFFEDDDHLIITELKTEYKCNYKLKICYIFREGLIVNGKKTGLWKTYNYDNTLKEEKVF